MEWRCWEPRYQYTNTPIHQCTNAPKTPKTINFKASNISNLFHRIQCIVFLMPDMFALHTFHWNSVMADLAANRRAMTLIFQWERDVGNVIQESFVSMHQANHELVQNTNVGATREPLNIQLQITVPNSSPPPPPPPGSPPPNSMMAEAVKQDASMDGDGAKLHYRKSIFNYRHSSSRSYPSRKYPTIWLDICQYDWVTPLSHEERFESLVYGYVRELCPGILPDVISIACLKYTGNVTVKSLTELGLNCCGYATKWGICKQCFFWIWKIFI